MTSQGSIVVKSRCYYSKDILKSRQSKGSKRGLKSLCISSHRRESKVFVPEIMEVRDKHNVVQKLGSF